MFCFFIKFKDCIHNSHPDPNLPTIDTEYLSDLDNPPGKHDPHINVSPRSRNGFTTQLSTENEKRPIDPTSPKQIHHSLRHNHFLPNNLSGSHCNTDSNPLYGSLENHEPVLVNGDLSLSEFHSEKLTENDRLGDKPNSNCNTFEGDCETAQVNSSYHLS